MTTTTKESEINMTIMSDRLSDKAYIDYMLTSTKLQILDDIAKSTSRDLHNLVNEHCKEALNYKDLVEKYNLICPKEADSLSETKETISSSTEKDRSDLTKTDSNKTTESSDSESKKPDHTSDDSTVTTKSKVKKPLKRRRKKKVVVESDVSNTDENNA